jgi:hypothetical protein
VSTVEQEAERLRAERHALAQPVDKFCPFYSARGGAATELFLLNATSEPLEVDLFASAETGQELPLGRYLIEGSRHLFLSLASLLPDDPSMLEGSLRASFLGDDQSLSAWAVLRDGRQSFEVPFVAPSKVNTRTLTSFWDASLAGPGAPPEVVFHLLNRTAAAVPFTVTFANGARPPHRLAGTAQPGERRRVEVPRSLQARGWARIEHEGEPGSLIGVGTMARGELLKALELVTPGATYKGPRYEAIRVPRDERSLVPPTRLALLNTGTQAQVVAIELLDQRSGALLRQRSVTLEPWTVRSEEVESSGGADLAASSGDTRLRVRAQTPAILVQGTSTLSAGEVVDLAFFPAEYGHGSGTYPVPDPQRYEVAVSIVNLGEEAATLVGQLYWAGGTSSVGPVQVPARSAHRFALSELVAESEPDLLGRRPDPLHPQGVFKWIVQRGSHELIGRTEVRRRDGRDGFGFNCFGCCWSLPSGSIVPPEVSLAPGDLVDFQASVTFSTCSGTMGPFGTTFFASTVPSPFSWDGSTVGTSGGADEDIEFEGVEEEIKVNCAVQEKFIFGIGRAKACQKLHNPNNYPENEGCVHNTDSCAECNACCQALKAQKLCKKKNPLIVEGDYQGCLGQCATDLCP